VQLQADDRIVIYSDGVTDAQATDGKFFGRRRLRDVIEAHPDLSAPDLHALLLQTLETFSEGAMQADDVTLLVLQYCPG